MIIGVLGSGKVGKALGKLWAANGHTVYFGSRNPQKIQHEISTYNGNVKAMMLAEAAKRADVILSALPYEAAEELYPTLAEALKGKVVIEASNPFGVSKEGGIISTLAVPAGVRTAQLLLGSDIVRAFNHIIVNLIPTHGHEHPLTWAIPVAADSQSARATADKLVRSAGYEPVNIGSLADSAILDPGGELFLRMYTPHDMRQVKTISKH
jgi:predicted dinucleotide-binding enzyme